VNKQLLKTKLSTISALLMAGQHSLIESILIDSNIEDLLSENAIAIARAEKKAPLVLFLCTLAIHNDINKDRAQHWLDIYQSIDSQELKGIVARLGERSILRETILSIIEQRAISKEKIIEIKGDRVLWIDSIDLSIDHNRWENAYTIFNVLANRTEKTKIWLEISKHLCDRHPQYISHTGLQKVDVDYYSLAKLYRYCANATLNAGLNDISRTLRRLEANTLEMNKNYTESISILKPLLKERNNLVTGFDLARVYTKNKQIELAIKELDKQILEANISNKSKDKEDKEAVQTESPQDQERSNSFNTIKAAQALGDLYAISNKSNINVFLAFGTLLGCMRDSDFLGHDKDIDVGVIGWENQYDLCIELLKSGKFMFDAQFLKQEKTFYIPILHKPTGMWIDIFIFHKSNDKLTTAVDFFFGYQQKYSVSKFSLIEHDFVGIKVLIPNDPNFYLEQTYLNWTYSDPAYITQLESPSVEDKGGPEFMLSARMAVFSAIHKKSHEKIMKAIKISKEYHGFDMNFDQKTLSKLEQIASALEVSN